MERRPARRPRIGYFTVPRQAPAGMAIPAPTGGAARSRAGP
ncbi:hypothetical protein L550_1149 [Bordetella pertussis H973]|nr:hypothetical protein L571_0823 [Bordetella pertussis 2371640]ETH52069.1 hypothetical protein L550_1149 [Bordetella pertussis H973]ETH54939.1 hypothetical protein L552_0789 [Bordetella pertussis I002]ETH65482.1 hypothetical protein L567_0866 [Bordetella pertussis STO1-CHLA-0006]ETH75367.1 hypothetical protein L555_0817 [Bordetella pertussis STO1-CHOC-0008]ETH89671.1 hypothetical protein L561_0909 [Bordetella pertussis STO1-CHOC-0019]CFP70137.1 Uncharacterised protein [Bordetella pertussis]